MPQQYSACIQRFEGLNLKNGNENAVSGTSTIHVFAEDDGSRDNNVV